MPEDVTFSGPVFDSRSTAAADAMNQRIEEALAQKVQDSVLNRLQQVIRVNHHVYESHIQTTRVDDGLSVQDGGVVYGPWLEGVGSRNRTTRFKGYFTFRTVTQEMDEKAVETAQVAVDDFVMEMSS